MIVAFLAREAESEDPCDEGGEEERTADEEDLGVKDFGGPAEDAGWFEDWHFFEVRRLLGGCELGVLRVWVRSRSAI